MMTRKQLSAMAGTKGTSNAWWQNFHVVRLLCFFVFLCSEMLMRQLNDKLIKLDRMFILPEGLPGRPLYRHILYAPAKSNAYGSSSFPGIVDCVANVLQARKKDDQSQELKWSGELRLHSTKVIQTIDQAARFLSPAFSGLNQSL